MPRKYGRDSSVEWADYGISPVKGLCPYIAETGGLEGNGGCPYCYMKQFFNRFKDSKRPLNQEIRRDLHDRFWLPRKPGKIAVCLNLDLFHPSIPDQWKREMIRWTVFCQDNTYIYLTKRPQEYKRFRFPPNSWLGTTWDGLEYTRGNLDFLARTTDTNRHLVKFVSFEPLLVRPPRGMLKPFKDLIHWIIIGGLTGSRPKKPPVQWVQHLIHEARECNMAVWVKRNCGYTNMIKEYPRLDTTSKKENS